jgi:hypothetical protein
MSTSATPYLCLRVSPPSGSANEMLPNTACPVTVLVLSLRSSGDVHRLAQLGEARCGGQEAASNAGGNFGDVVRHVKVQVDWSHVRRREGKGGRGVGSLCGDVEVTVRERGVE